MKILQSKILLYDRVILWHGISNGVVNFTPLGMIYLNFLKSKINSLMFSLSYAQISVGSLSSTKLWKESGRFDK